MAKIVVNSRQTLNVYMQPIGLSYLPMFPNFSKDTHIDMIKDP